MSGGGYDISASVSEASTQGFQNTLGNFTVGGGGKASIVWPIVIGVLVVAALFLSKRKK